MSDRKQIRVTLPAEQAAQFDEQKRKAEDRMAASLTDSQFVGMIVAHGLKLMSSGDGPQ